MFATGSKHEQGFRFQMHVVVEQQGTQFLAQLGPPRLTRHMNRFALGTQPFGQPFDVTALAGAIDAFERDESTFHFPPL